MKVNANGSISSGYAGQDRQTFESMSPTNGSVPAQMTASDNLATNMNKPELALRGSRADALIEMAGDDGYRLSPDAPRTGKMKG